MTFTQAGEQWLNDWLEENAYVCWVEHPEPWVLEKEVFGSLSLPLNIQDNRSHPFASVLSNLRQEAKRLAKENPIVNDAG
jgi:GIY-YIG catalytic domain